MRFLTLILMLSLSFGAFGLDYKIDHIPNGNKFECNNCHFPGGEGGPLTPFGEQVKSFGMDSWKVDWSKLYNRDADNDGFTNGEELGDPNGEWRIGDPDPVVSYELTRPWDADDYPTSVNSQLYFKEINAYPNPFNEKVTINLCLEFSGHLLIEVFDLNGDMVRILSSNYQLPGQVSFVWDGRNDAGEQVSPGLYCISITNDKAFTSINLILE